MKGYTLGLLQTMPLALLEVILYKLLVLWNLVELLLRFSSVPYTFLYFGRYGNLLFKLLCFMIKAFSGINCNISANDISLKFAAWSSKRLCF